MSGAEPEAVGIHPLIPREIVAELDRHIVGQAAAKRAVAIALRNRWRRLQVPAELRDVARGVGAGGEHALLQVAHDQLRVAQDVLEVAELAAHLEQGLRRQRP